MPRIPHLESSPLSSSFLVSFCTHGSSYIQLSSDRAFSCPKSPWAAPGTFCWAPFRYAKCINTILLLGSFFRLESTSKLFEILFSGASDHRATRALSVPHSFRATRNLPQQLPTVWILRSYWKNWSISVPFYFVHSISFHSASEEP